jgi:peptide/nickel transport system substrate-binding protein
MRRTIVERAGCAESRWRMRVGPTSNLAGESASSGKRRRSQPRATVWALAWLVVCTACRSSPARSPDEYVVLLPRDVQELDPRHVGDAYGHKVSRLLFASLVTIDAQTLEVIPDLAQRVDVLSPSEYRVILRPALTFSDGSALDAHDVLATFRSVTDPRIQSRYAPTYRRIARMHAPDPQTVVFELDGPHATFLTDLELPVLRAEDASRRIARLGEAPPIGAGPYVLESRVAGSLELRANPRWHAGTARMPKLHLLAVRDDNIRALRMLAGAGDVALNAVPVQLLPLFASSEFSVRSAHGTGTTYIGVNMQAGALADPRVRRAIAHAIDRAALIDAKLAGYAQLARTPIPPGHWAFAPDTPGYAFDPARARALLREAGVAHLRLSLRCGSDRLRLSIARAIAAMLRDVGIELELRPSETASLIAELDRGRFELTMLQLPELIEPHVLSWFFGSGHVPGPGREGANRWRMTNAELDAALERGRRSTVRAERIAAYRDVQRVLAEQLPVIALWHEDVVAVTSARAASLVVPRDGRFSTLAR